MKITKSNTTEDNLLTAMGISDERADELKAILNDTQSSTDDVVEHMAKLCEKLPVDNELAFCLFQMGAHAESNRQRSERLEQFKKMMEGEPEPEGTGDLGDINNKKDIGAGD